MPRGKNYVNNNRGVFLQASKKNKLKQSMRQCEYGSACNRPDCIYRHDFVEEKSNEVCLQFLAGICAFSSGGCRKRHPNKDEKARLLQRYKKQRCRFGDECRTEGCLYLHPSEIKPIEPAYMEPANLEEAFPALGSSAAAAAVITQPLSSWKKADIGVPTTIPQNNVIPPPAWYGDAAFAPFCTPANPQQQQQQQYGGYGYDTGGYGGYVNDGYGGYDATAAQLQQQQGGEIPTTAPSFNASAKEFVPGSFRS